MLFKRKGCLAENEEKGEKSGDKGRMKLVKAWEKRRLMSSYGGLPSNTLVCDIRCFSLHTMLYALHVCVQCWSFVPRHQYWILPLVFKDSDRRERKKTHKKNSNSLVLIWHVLLNRHLQEEDSMLHLYHLCTVIFMLLTFYAKHDGYKHLIM